jgi:purine-binding chemotaxis protein CheW
MSTAGSKLECQVAEMRRLFDESFSRAITGQAAETEPMLAISVEGECFALRVREISGLAEIREKVVPVPSRVPELLGLTGVRGVVVPVFSMAKLLGYDTERSQARWLVYCGERRTPIALAFEAMERLFEVPACEIFTREQAPGRRYVNATVSFNSMPRGVISVSALVEYIQRRGASEPGSKR